MIRELKKGDPFAYVWRTDYDATWHECWGIFDHIDKKGKLHISHGRALWCDEIKRWTDYSPRTGHIEDWQFIDCDPDQVWADYCAAVLTGLIEGE